MTASIQDLLATPSTALTTLSQHLTTPHNTSQHSHNTMHISSLANDALDIIASFLHPTETAAYVVSEHMQSRQDFIRYVVFSGDVDELKTTPELHNYSALTQFLEVEHFNCVLWLQQNGVPLQPQHIHYLSTPKANACLQQANAHGLLDHRNAEYLIYQMVVYGSHESLDYLLWAGTYQYNEDDILRATVSAIHKILQQRGPRDTPSSDIWKCAKTLVAFGDQISATHEIMVKATAELAKNTKAIWLLSLLYDNALVPVLQHMVKSSNNWLEYTPDQLQQIRRGTDGNLNHDIATTYADLGVKFTQSNLRWALANENYSLAKLMMDYGATLPPHRQTFQVLAGVATASYCTTKKGLVYSLADVYGVVFLYMSILLAMLCGAFAVVATMKLCTPLLIPVYWYGPAVLTRVQSTKYITMVQELHKLVHGRPEVLSKH